LCSLLVYIPVCLLVFGLWMNVGEHWKNSGHKTKQNCYTSCCFTVSQWPIFNLTSLVFISLANHMKLHIPDKVSIFLVHTIVCQMHTNILDVFTSSVIFNSGKSKKKVIGTSSHQDSWQGFATLNEINSPTKKEKNRWTRHSLQVSPFGFYIWNFPSNSEGLKYFLQNFSRRRSKIFFTDHKRGYNRKC